MFSPIQLTPNMDNATMTSALNDMFRQVESENRTRVIKDEQGVNRIILGRDPDGNYVLKISVPGVDVLIAKDSELIFNSNQNVFKIVDKVTRTTATYAINGVASQWKSFNVASPDVYEHNLGYIPVVLAFIEVVPGQRVLMPYTFSSTPSTSQAVFTQVSVNATDQYLYFTDLTRVFGAYTGTGGGHEVTAFLLQESAA